MTGSDTPRSAPRGRGEAEAVASPRLSPKNETLFQLLPDILSKFKPVIGADIDEVTCVVPREAIQEVSGLLKADPRLLFAYFRLLTVVDYVESAHEFEVVYHLYSLEHRHKMVLKTRVPEADPWVPSVTGVWKGADWYEREMQDLFGVEFRGHPDPRRLILPDDFEGFPGRKAYPLHEYDEY